MMKDLGLSQDAANRTGSATPLGSLSLQVTLHLAQEFFHTYIAISFCLKPVQCYSRFYQGTRYVNSTIHVDEQVLNS